MDLITYSYNKSLLSHMNDSVALRASFLIADEVFAAGNLYHGIYIDRTLEPHTAQQAAKVLLTFEVNPEAIRALKDVIQCIKDYKNIKQKTTPIINSIKRMERTIMKAWEDCRKNITDFYVKTGLPELKKVRHTDALTILGAGSDAEELSKNSYACSKVLLLETRERNAPVEQTFFMLQAEYKQMHADTGFNFNNWNELNLTFCNINVLTGAELVAVREQLRPAAKPFCEAIDKWSAMLPTLTPEQSYGWYQQSIKPAAAALQQAIDANEILNEVNRLTKDNAKVCIHIGEAPTQVMWLFYDVHQSIPEATKRVLEKPESISFGAKRKPYFSISYVNWENVHNLKPKAEEEITAVKKSIVFD